VKITLEVLELLGLLIAGLDFLGISPKIQAWIDKRRRGYFFWLDAKGNEKIAFSNAFSGVISLASTVLLIWFCYASYTHDPAAPVILAWWFLVGVAPFLFLFVVLPSLYNLLLIINRSPSKTVGSFAFGLALVSWGLQRWWQHLHPCS
jgi:hypothetical protein